MWKIILFGVSLGTVFLFTYGNTCNEAVCGSVVSKCLLTQSCNCDLKNCTCCKDCFNCLSYLFSECCSCVDKCPSNEKANAKRTGFVESYVKDFIDPVPGLFQALTQEPDEQNRWISTTYPVDFDVFSPKKEIKIHMQTNEQDVTPKKDVMTLNCTVAFMSQCMSNSKCKSTCITMGASSYRWFHDACCECIGQHCINYGINESRCKDCPVSNSADQEDFEDEDEEPYYPDDDDLDDPQQEID
ncbi:hypothetical protein WA026_000201 [Henosepilachna vigintioctopunctata]|uniref:Protein twisted gastrulation n=1 Tax=Henosepilachna vigintioctopunctata TaxID=420089 RepID=A0AAW1V517_9CUCU